MGKYGYKDKKATQQKRMIGIIAAAVIVIAVVVLALTLGGKDAANETPAVNDTHSPVSSDVQPVASDYVQIDIENYGSITAELYGNVAPVTVENFLKLTDEGFYDGLTFHRIISGFMIQGGDPKGNGTGGSGTNIKGEFSANGVANPITHERGVLSMARSSAYDSASSQFFIMHEAAPHLDGQYAAFGRVLSGVEIVDAICEATPVTDSNGSVAAENQPVITAIRRIEKPE